MLVLAPVQICEGVPVLLPSVCWVVLLQLPISFFLEGLQLDAERLSNTLGSLGVLSLFEHDTPARFVHGFWLEMK